MGLESSQPIKPLEKIDIDVVSDKVFHHLTLNRDRKINELANKERALRDAIIAGKKKYEDAMIDLISIVNIFKYITAANFVLRYAKIIKDHSLQICLESKKKNSQSLVELAPYFQGIIWSAGKLNLTYIQEFNQMLYKHFQPNLYQQIVKFDKLDKELVRCFNSLEPSNEEINQYLLKFISRYQIENFDLGVKAKQEELKKPEFIEDSYNDQPLDEIMKNITKKASTKEEVNAPDYTPAPIPQPMVQKETQLPKKQNLAKKFNNDPESFTEEIDPSCQGKQYHEIPFFVRIDQLKVLKV